MKRNRGGRGWWMVAAAVLGLSAVGNGQWADRRGQSPQLTGGLSERGYSGLVIGPGSIGLMGSGRVERPGRDEDLWPEAGADGRYRVIDASRYDAELQREHELILCEGHRVLWRLGEQLRQEALESVRWGAVGGALGKTVRAAVKSARQVVRHGHSVAKSAPIRWSPLNGPGPLGEKVASTFRGGSYTELVTSEPTMLYRVYGGNSPNIGPYWTRTPPAGALQSRIDSALLPQWGNTAENIVKIQVPAGTRIFEGFAAPQGELVGGGNQVFIPNVNRAWIVL